MFKLHNPTKTEDHSAYLVHSAECPVCHTSTSVLITPEKLYLYNQGGYAHEVLSEYDPAIVERFITGLCGECWNLLFKGEEDMKPLLHPITIKDTLYHLTYRELNALSYQLQCAVAEADVLEYVTSKKEDN